MKKHQFEITLKYAMDTAHKGAPYTIDGTHYMNHGDLMETLVKHAFGFSSGKEQNSRFDCADDIEEIHASVKSSKATLTSVILADTFEETKREYFKRTPSRVWFFAMIVNGALVVYEMNAREFDAFMDAFTYWTKEHRVRFKYASSKMVRWFERAI